MIGDWWRHKFVICHLFRRLPDHSAGSSMAYPSPAFDRLLAIGYWQSAPIRRVKAAATRPLGVRMSLLAPLGHSECKREY